MSQIFKTGWEIVSQAVKRFYEKNLLNYSASVAFFTIFSLPGVLIIMFLIAGFFFSEDQVREELFYQVGRVVGPESAQQIKEVMRAIGLVDHTYFATVIGIATILFGATSVFVSIQDGLNVSWNLKSKPRIFALKFMINRLWSFAMVISIGFIMLVSLTIDAILVLFEDFLFSIFSDKTVNIMEVAHFVISTFLIWFVFMLIYKFLPNGRVKLKYLVPGALIATILFILGKYLIGLYLGNSTLGTAYGAAGSLVVLLIWVYYSSVVLLFGSELIAIYTIKMGGKITPEQDAVKVVTKEVGT